VGIMMCHSLHRAVGRCRAVRPETSLTGQIDRSYRLSSCRFREGACVPQHYSARFASIAEEAPPYHA